jgi:flagellum-specific peptidoglycan hydrolase FlgJ
MKSEAEYFDYLRQNYAEDPNYVDKLKKIIEKNKE